jgi:hypothetical protein
MTKKLAKDFAGVDIREVWDFRLSTGAPMLFNSGETWEVKIFANDAPDGEPVVLAEFVTDVKTVDEDGKRNPHDSVAIAACYAWLHSVRDNFKRPDFDDRIEHVAAINAANRALAQVGAQ